MAAIQVGDPIYVIEAEACADCCACSDACPCDAIIEDDTAIDRRRDHLD
jgi:Fe-S-cluster-containing hydrogenase component 2